MRRFISRVIAKLLPKDKHFRIKVECNSEWYGNSYGGFFVHPDLIEKGSIVYSFGIGEDISFDRMVLEKHGCSVYGFDPTPKSITWINNQTLPTNFFFYEYGISDKDGTMDFYLPKNKEYVSGSLIVQDAVDTDRKITVDMKSIRSIVSELDHKQIDILKMDIEGSEYDVIDNVLNLGLPIKQILIEFHDRFFENGAKKTKQVIKKLEKHGYLLFAISGSKEEISFIHKSALK